MLSSNESPSGYLYSRLRQSPPKWLLTSFLVGAALIPLLIIAISYQPRVGFTSLIYFGSDFASQQVSEIRDLPKVVYPGSGYDGQFYAQLAIDPLLNHDDLPQALDNPSYRARRIFLPWLGYIVGFGQPTLILQTYALLNFGFYGLLVWMLYGFFRPHTGQSLFCFAGALLSTGVIASLSRALPDLPAAVLLIMASLNPLSISGLIYFTLAVFSKETSLIAMPFLFFSQINYRSPSLIADLWRVVKKALWVLLPFSAWIMYITWRLPLGDLDGTRNFSLPFVSIVQHISENLALFAQNRSIESLAECLVSISLLGQGAYLLVNRQPKKVLWLTGVVFFSLFCVLGSSVMVEQLAYTRAVLPLTLAFNMLLKTEMTEKFLGWWLLGNSGLFFGLIAALLKMLVQ